MSSALSQDIAMPAFSISSQKAGCKQNVIQRSQHYETQICVQLIKSRLTSCTITINDGGMSSDIQGMQLGIMDRSLKYCDA